MAKELDRIAFDYWAGVASRTDLEAWATVELGREQPHPEAYELFGLNHEEAARAALRLAAEILGFEPVSERGEVFAQDLLRQLGQQLLQEEISPFRFCKMVQFLEVEFMDLHRVAEGYEYPEWLGDLWNCCDWCDERWTLGGAPHLEAEVRRMLHGTGTDHGADSRRG